MFLWFLQFIKCHNSFIDTFNLLRLFGIDITGCTFGLSEMNTSTEDAENKFIQPGSANEYLLGGAFYQSNSNQDHDAFQVKYDEDGSQNSSTIPVNMRDMVNILWHSVLLRISDIIIHILIDYLDNIIKLFIIRRKFVILPTIQPTCFLQATMAT